MKGLIHLKSIELKIQSTGQTGPEFFKDSTPEEMLSLQLITGRATKAFHYRMVRMLTLFQDDPF